MGRSKDLKTETLYRNNETFIDYAKRLKLLATSLFTWKGLDENLGYGASNFLEETLFENGMACFVKDKDLGYLVLKASSTGKRNVYNLPTKITATSFEYHKEYELDDVVLILNNKLGVPTQRTLDNIAYRLYEAERTIDVNVVAQKTPVIFEGDDKSILTLQNAYMNFIGNVPIVIANKNFDLNSRINAIRSDAPYLVDKLTQYKHELWNEALTYLGINNANTDKKERLITDEVNANDEMINYYLNCFYSTRKQACDLINEKFFNGKKVIDLSINKVNVDLYDIDDLDPEEKEDEYGQLYD